MPRVVRFPDDEVEGLDEEFLYHLNRGADYLARGEPEPARVALLRAAEMRPRDPKALGLLGQAYYRLSRYADAADAYARLVQESPLEAGAQVNLGLALLKAGRAAEAIIHLERALDLSPEHRRAMGYLGLAWLEQGNVARAREWFERAGRDQMVARCDALLHGGGDRAEKRPEGVAPRGDKRARGREAPRPEAVQKPPRRPAERRADAAGWKVIAAATAEDERPVAESDDEVRDALRALEPTGGATRKPAGAVAAVAPPETAATAAPEAEPEPEPVPATGAEADGRPAAVPRPTTFTVGRVVQVAVRGEVLVRLAGLVAAEGQVELAPEMKRFRGRATEESFGKGNDALQRARGDGTLVFAQGDRRFTVVDLDRGPAHFREDVVFGFDAALSFENGRLASPGAPEIELVRIAGEGSVLVAARGEVAFVEVAPERPVRVSAAALVGWSGALTPRLLPLARPHADPDAVELAGEGRILLDPAAALA